MARSFSALDKDFHFQDHDPILSGIDTSSFHSSITSVPSVGHNMDERIIRRAARSNSPVNENVIEHVLRVRRFR
jgi:hypothetical protein